MTGVHILWDAIQQAEYDEKKPLILGANKNLPDGFFGKYSLAKLGMARYIDDRDQDKFVTEEAANWYATWGSWAFMDEPVLDPAFTTEENEELSKLKSEVNDILSMSYDDFIMGNRPVEEWTQVQDQIRDSALRICEIYNAAAARAVR